MLPPYQACNKPAHREAPSHRPNPVTPNPRQNKSLLVLFFRKEHSYLASFPSRKYSRLMKLFSSEPLILLSVLATGMPSFARANDAISPAQRQSQLSD
jgi:hypothetical protein